tara:strand:- start:51 stop:248 length:198 start_codon:yes stop_codon:yes gene_type:complete
MKKFIPSTQKGKDTLQFIESLQNKNLTGREILDATANFRESWEENQLPNGVKIITNSFGLPEIVI